MAAARREASWLSPTRRRFLEVEQDVAGPRAWNAESCTKLWLYNLHYFDDLNASDADSREAWHREEIARWIAQNPAGDGNGWEPYPLSLRIVNWIKWTLAGHEVGAVVRHSLAVQTRYLRENLEHHLLGNHLLANAKALIFAGCFFEGREARGWLSKGVSLLKRELREQLLADGGHFERSPMYHSIIVEDLLDLINLLRCFAGSVPPAIKDTGMELERAVDSMRRWLMLMTHPDGEIALFNDSAFGIAPTPEELHAYARRLGLGPCPLPTDGIHVLENSGYVRLQRAGALAILDVGEIGPSYLPGHAHADSLGFEFSLGGARLVVDSGASLYEANAERLRQRGTAAHNTIEVDGEDSSEVWSSFRVARRARPHGLVVHQADDSLQVRCGHDGYMRRPRKLYHSRGWRLEDHRLIIHDRLDGAFESAVARLHLHPDVQHLTNGVLALPGQGAITCASSAGDFNVDSSTWHPRFGVSKASSCLRAKLAGPELRTTLTW